jgi:outer membrane protein assembly factor BamB
LEVSTVESARSRWRAVPGVLATLVTIVCGAILADHLILQAEWWQVNRTVTHVPRPQLADLGPPAGPVTTSWQLSTPVSDSELPAYDRVAYAIMDGELVVVSGHGLTVRDARTGRERWHYYRGQWSLLGWARTGQVLVAYLERTGHRGNRLMVGLDAVSGTLLWRQRGDVPAATERTTLRWPAGAGVVIVTEDGRHTLYGRSAATGRRIWSKRLAHGCLLPEAVPYGSGSSETLAAFSLDCGARDRTITLDPRTGRTLFTTNAAHAAVSVDGDVTAVFDGAGLYAYDRSGHAFLIRRGEDVCREMCPIAVTGGHLLVAYDLTDRPEDGTATRRLESVEIASGTMSWRREMSGYTALSVAGGLLYGLRSRLAEPLLPVGIDVIDPDTGDGTTVPAPLVTRPGLDGVRPWLAAGGGLLYVAVPTARPRPFGGARLVALRGGVRGAGPPELAGVPARDWPDACALLTKHDLPHGYSEVASSAHVEGLRVPAGCTYRQRRQRARGSSAASAGPEREASTLSVTVQWVAADPTTASALFWAARDTQSGIHDPVKAGDAAYGLGVPSGTVVMRVGRTIVTVTAGIPGTATHLATVIAARLRAGA